MAAAQGPASPGRPRPLSYDDFVVGEVVPFGRKAVSREDIVGYARAFDPQPFHLSEELAKDSNVGRLIASGYHTCCILMRMAAEDLMGGPDALGAPGVEEVRFLKPVEPGDDLAARCTCLDKRELKSKPGVGIIRCLFELTNQRDEVVISWDVTMFRRVHRRGST